MSTATARRDRAIRQLSEAERNGAALLRVGYDPNCLLCYDNMHEGARTDRRKYAPPHTITGTFIPRGKKATRPAPAPAEGER